MVFFFSRRTFVAKYFLFLFNDHSTLDEADFEPRQKKSTFDVLSTGPRESFFFDFHQSPTRAHPAPSVARPDTSVSVMQYCGSLHLKTRGSIQCLISSPDPTLCLTRSLYWTAPFSALLIYCKEMLGLTLSQSPINMRSASSIQFQW